MLTMTSQDTVTVEVCINGLLAFANKAIPFMLALIAGEKDVSSVTTGIRDEIVSITASSQLLQDAIVASANLAVPAVFVSSQRLTATLKKCMQTYSKFEALHAQTGRVKSRSFHRQIASTRYPTTDILKQLQQHSSTFYSLVSEMQR